MNLTILAAGKPFRGSSPSVLVPVSENCSVLDWNLRTFNEYCDSINFVGGYHFNEIIEKYPSLNYTLNSNWMNNGSLASLLMSPLDRNKSLCCCYGDVIFSKSAVTRFLKNHSSPLCRKF